MTRIGIIGNGNVGSALEKGIKNTKHEVRTTGHDPKQVREVADWAETIVLAVPYDQRENAMQRMGNACDGKTIVDVTNALGEGGRFLGSVERSGAEELQRNHQETSVVKAFNTVFAQNMSNGNAQGEPLSLFVAGDDQGKDHVLELGNELGFDTIDAGPLENARYLETLGFLNITLGYGQELGTDSGFRYVHPGVRTKKEMAAQASR